MKNRKESVVAVPSYRRVEGCDSPLDLFDRRGAAAYVGVPTRTFDRLVSRKMLHVIRHGPRVVRFTRCDLDTYLQRVRAAPAVR